MKVFLILIILLITYRPAFSATDLIFLIESAYKNNPKLKAERENLKATKENINISKREFIPSVTITGSIDSSISTERTNQEGANLPDTNSDTSTKTLSVDQKIFQGFEGYNTLKKSKLEVQQANYKLKNIEQEIILKSSVAYYDLFYKNKSRCLGCV